MTTPVKVTAEEFVVHVFIVLDDVTVTASYDLALRLWGSLRSFLGSPVEASGLPVDPPDAAEIRGRTVEEEEILAVQQSRTCDAQAVLRRRHDVLNLSALFTGEPAGWAEFERRWDLVVDGVAQAFLGEVRIYYGLTASAADALPATADLAVSVAGRLPPVACARGWEQAGVTTKTGFPLWELSPREDGRRLRRVLTLTPVARDSDLSAWVWSDKGPDMPMFARYLGHAAKVRHHVRLWKRGRSLRDLRLRAADIAARLRAGDPSLAPDQPGAVELALTSALTSVAAMRRTVEIAADNMSRTIADAVAIGEGRNVFADDRSLVEDLLTWFDDETEYLRLARDLLRELRRAVVPVAGPARAAADEPLIGLLTAMPIEFQAVRSLLENVQDASAGRAHYVRGELPSREPKRPHKIVLVQTGATATNAAAESAAGLVHSFPSISCLIMAGVAAGVPAPADPARHVRLGDVVVATWGIVDYAHVVVHDGGATSLRATFPRPWPYLTRVADQLEADELTGLRPWEQWLDSADELFRRPPDKTDRLVSGAGSVRHPRRAASGHRPDRPKIHKGRIGSADISLRDAGLRDGLAAEHNLRALEMEGAGVGTSAFLNDRHWFMVRGISDYADRSYTVAWRPYAALAAAAYIRALLAAALPFDELG
ncbi:CATRA conflict system CASPASE/TPR repeat-associated protein [Amycolatopsis rifamycinica]|uniref:Uncharacterized protein n=1 Tax=Amycolatopsis rifamycinica TaxID=287986 RepID=A0A066U7F3_9PSEU|nr:CATRA conflict system CASPASE/TPR repeat-associated protein [Amycolatopsis rifamycinica]KDN21772.1 hypothetical protein DV20_12640 [Amycolatopsis rifamycinica]